jgi:hypothetical protein
MGNFIGISNQSANVNSIIARNGEKIMNLSEDMTIDVVDAGFIMYYTGTTRGWVVI